MTGQPYAVRFSASAAKVLATLPEHVEDSVWNVLDAAADDPWGFGQWNTEDPEGEDVRYASVGQMSLTYWVNRRVADLEARPTTRGQRPDPTTSPGQLPAYSRSA